jgi:hypothetical protein
LRQAPLYEDLVNFVLDIGGLNLKTRFLSK